MVILALDTVTAAGSLGLWRDGLVHAQPGDAARRPSERLPLEIVSFLDAHTLTLDGVDGFAVVAGPGSYTGVRVGVATIQGLALASGKRVVAVSAFEAAIAAAAVGPAAAAQVIAVCFEGPRESVLFGAWRVRAGEAATTETEVLVAPDVGSPDDAAARLSAASAGQSLTVVGAGGVRLAPSRFAAQVTFDPGTELLGAGAARVAARPGAVWLAPHAIRPVYLGQPPAGRTTPRGAATSR